MTFFLCRHGLRHGIFRFSSAFKIAKISSFSLCPLLSQLLAQSLMSSKLAGWVPVGSEPCPTVAPRAKHLQVKRRPQRRRTRTELKEHPSLALAL